jgi:hypothetical protein
LFDFVRFEWSIADDAYFKLPTPIKYNVDLGAPTASQPAKTTSFLFVTQNHMKGTDGKTSRLLDVDKVTPDSYTF